MSTQEAAQGATPAPKFVRPLPGPLAAQVKAADAAIDAMRKAGQPEPSSQQGAEPQKPEGGGPEPQKPEGSPPEPQKAEAANAEPQKPDLQKGADNELKPGDKPKEVTAEQWRARYESMRGRAAAYERQAADMRAELDALRSEVAEMRAAGGQKASTSKYVTDEERRDYGDDLLDVVRRQAREEVDTVKRDYEDQIKQLKQELKQVTGRIEVSDTERMYSYLNETVPNWIETNRDPDFLAWLDRIDVYSGQPRLDMLKLAYAQNDGHRVAAFFKGYAQEVAAVAPQPTTSEQRAPKAQLSLEKLAAPGKPMTAAPERPADQPDSISRAQIAEFYADKAAGKYRGREKDADAFERRIFKASAEGRIVN